MQRPLRGPLVPLLTLAALACPLPALACPGAAPSMMLLMAPAFLGMALIVLSGLGCALYDMGMALLGRPLSRRVAIVQAAVMAGHAGVSFWGTLITEGSDRMMLFGYLVFSCLILIHAVGEARAAA